MKSLKEIESISFEELERIAEDPAIMVPGKVTETVKSGVMAAAVPESVRRFPWARRAPLYLAAAAAACALVIFAVPSSPEDTFSDPETAYRQVEKTMSLIAQKMDTGLALAESAPDPILVMNEVIERTNR